MLSAKLFVGVLLFCALNSGSAKKNKNKHECYVDEEGDKEDPNNIYSCNDSEKCCHEEGKPSCCKEKETKVAVMEQVKVWGTLAGIIILIALLMFCFRNDGDCCWDRKDGGRYKYCCCGPIIYREGKGPDMKPECIYQRFEDEEDHQGKVNHHEPSLRRPEGAPPPYQDSQIKNVNETEPHKGNKSPINNEHNEDSKDHQKAQNDHETHPTPDEHNDPAGSNKNHSEDHQGNQDQSHQPNDHQQDQHKPKQPEGDLISFNND